MNLDTTKSLRAVALAAGLMFAAQTLWAHPLGSLAGGFAPGFAHPLGGMDHVLAMVAVGLWAAQRGGRYVWLLPMSFLGVMLAGGLLGVWGMPLPAVESGIAASVAVLGLLIAMAARLSALPTLILVAGFALFHGHAHGTELAAGSAAAAYAAGFATATAALHLAGLALGASVNRLATLRPLLTVSAWRLSGGVIALTGAALFTATL
ncbi:MAG: HupE/UreJ family protein [Candidatus Lambdaproteobacteria bacterium]|nr:HupE/UreJ family protein [Candidatus Lambdaproteobacteria bacterium]